MGLCFGIMRGSGGGASINYQTDIEDNEGNDYWELVPGKGVTAHPDMCNSYGKEWDYNGHIQVSTPEEAETEIRLRCPATAENILWPRWSISVQELRNAGWTVSGDMTRKAEYLYFKVTINSKSEGYINVYTTPIVVSSTRNYTGPTVYTKAEVTNYIVNLWNQYKFDLVSHDDRHLILAVNPTDWSTLAYLRGVYFGYESDYSLDNGLGITSGRISLKLRAEKPNPYFNVAKEESDTNRRYLQISNPNLRNRGLADQFYKEYSYFIRNARIWKGTVKMELAQLLSIDKTKRVTVGSITGFIRKMQYSVSKQTGLGNVTMEIMYI